MNCPIRTEENKEWLLDYAAGRLESEKAVVVRQHVENCDVCARFVEAQQMVWNALDSWEPQAVSQDFDRRLYRAIEARPASWMERFFGGFHLLWRPAIPLAAACLLIIASVILHTPQVPVSPAESQARMEKIEPDQVERTLDDIEMLRQLALQPSGQEDASKPL